MFKLSNLYVFIEGYYDQIFVENILSLFLLKEKSIIVYSIPYAQKNKKLINKEIKSKSKSNHYYVLLTDLDSSEYNCITHRKKYMLNFYSNLEWDKTFIVKEEIESWFIAGLDTSLSQFKNFKVPDKTDFITKEDFDLMIENNSNLVKEDFLLELSHYYDIDLAMKRNTSFNYFINKLMDLVTN